mmetsp:Transcript_26188/g.70850  ORF Transcript_26188/g.70850 Transcript_26188/m.70850 type:complete len:174 (+) Transcript_26188:386-907(+)
MTVKYLGHSRRLSPPCHPIISAQIPAATVNAASKRMMRQPMGSSQPAKRQRVMRASNSTTRQTKAFTSQVWGGLKQVGRPKSLKKSAFPKLPKQQPGASRGAALMSAAFEKAQPVNNYSPLPKKQSKQKVKHMGWSPNLELYALHASAVPSFTPMPHSFLGPSIPCAPSELTA